VTEHRPLSLARRCRGVGAANFPALDCAPSAIRELVFAWLGISSEAGRLILSSPLRKYGDALSYVQGGSSTG